MLLNPITPASSLPVSDIAPDFQDEKTEYPPDVRSFKPWFLMQKLEAYPCLLL